MPICRICTFNDLLPTHIRLRNYLFTGGEGDADKYKGTSQGLDSFSYVTMNPGFGETMRGLCILQQIAPFRTSQIQVLIHTCCQVSFSFKTL